MSTIIRCCRVVFDVIYARGWWWWSRVRCMRCVKQCHPRADYWGSFCLLLLSAVVQKQIFRWCRNGHLCTISFHLEAFCRCKFEAGLAQHATIAQWRLAQLNIIGGKKCSRSWQTPKGPPAWPFVETPSPGLRTKAISKELISRHFCQSG